MQFFADHFPALSFHAAGLHDDGVPQPEFLFFDKIEKGVSHADKQHILPRFVERDKLLDQLVIIAQIIAAVWIVAAFDEIVDHIDERRAFAVEIARQKRQYDVIFDVAVKLGKCLAETAFVKRNIRDQVPARDRARRAGTREYFFRGCASREHVAALEELYRKERNLNQRFDMLSVGTQKITKFPVHLIVFVLVPKNFQSNLFELLL